ncbi:recombination mediator RecR [bacterium]|nr:recombination mediator RecR [bacterium]
MYTGALARMIDELGRMPGVGPKTAQRLAFHLLRQDRAAVERLAHTLVEAKDKIQYCATCFSLCEEEICSVCRHPRRDVSIICVVEEPNDVFALERTKAFQGKYHVLMGTLSPIEGIGPDDLKITELLKRLESNEVKEVVIATNPDVEGEATALYLAKLIKPLGVRVSRLASGLPAGGDLEYADDVTISQAISGRREL